MTMCNCNCEFCQNCAENEEPEVDPYEDDPDYQRYKRGEISKLEWWDIKGWGYYFCEPLSRDKDIFDTDD